MAFLKKLLGIKSKPKVVIVTPPSFFPTTFMRLQVPPYSLVPVVSMTPLLPLGPAYVATSLKQAGYDVKVVDLTFIDKRRLSVDMVRDAILNHNPDAVGLSALTWTITKTYEIADALKEEEGKLPIIVGGSHASALPHRTLEECNSIDAAVVGEGEYVFKDFLDVLFEKGFNGEMAGLKGLVFRHEGNIMGDPAPAYIEDLDALPFPDRRMFDLQRYLEFSKQFIAKQVPVASIMTSRGCPNRCVFCYRSSSGYRYRARSPENVVKEIEHLKGLGFNEVQIPDDNFTHDQQRIMEICRLLKKRNLDMTFDLPNGIRVDRADEELLQAMYDVGFYSIHLGVESGDPDVLRTIKKGITVDQVRTAVKAAKKIGYKIILYMIIGLPGSSVEAERRSLELVQELDVPFTFSVCTPYPGSPLWNSLGDEMKDTSWDRFDETDVTDPLYLPEGMTLTELQECVNRANDYLLKPKIDEG